MTDTEHTIFTEAENPNKSVLHTEIHEVLKNKGKSLDPTQWDVLLNNLQPSVCRKVSDERSLLVSISSVPLGRGRQ